MQDAGIHDCVLGLHVAVGGLAPRATLWHKTRQCFRRQLPGVNPVYFRQQSSLCRNKEASGGVHAGGLLYILVVVFSFVGACFARGLAYAQILS